VKVLLFDIDGTLVHTGGAGKRSFVDALRAGFDVDAALDGVAFAGQTDPMIIREFFLRHGIELSTRNFHVFFEHYLRCLQKNVLTSKGHVKPGVQQILEICQNGNGTSRQFRTGLLTGNIEAGARIKLNQFDLWRYFELGAFGNDHEDRNEIARIARDRALAHFGNRLAPEDIVVIGDTPRDIQCGKSIGARTLAVATGPHSVAELRSVGPSLALQDLSDVNGFLDWVGRM
jgi:phosphoglycolate phosphatase